MGSIGVVFLESIVRILGSAVGISLIMILAVIIARKIRK